MPSKGESTTDAYLAWLDKYMSISASMGDLCAELLRYQQSLDDPAQARVIDKFRKSVIRVRSQYNQAQQVLEEI